MSRLSESTLSPEVMGVMLQMRLLIKNEFGMVLSLYDEEAVNKFCDYGCRSQNPKLSAMTQKLASLTGDALAPLETPVQAPERHILARQASDSIVEWFDLTDFAQPVCVVYQHVPPFVIDKPQRRCLLGADLEELLPLGEAETAAIRLEKLSPLQLMTASKQSRSLPLEALWWFCGTRLSHGQLLQRLTTYQAFRLKRWPDFGILPQHRQHTRMATFLMKHPGSLEALVKATGVTNDEAVGFLNAASLCEWLQEEKTRAAIAPNSSRPGLQGIIGRIRMRLGLAR